MLQIIFSIIQLMLPMLAAKRMAQYIIWKIYTVSVKFLSKVLAEIIIFHSPMPSIIFFARRDGGVGDVLW
jgi:hypothetical protein